METSAHEEEETLATIKWNAGGSCRMEENQKTVFSPTCRQNPRAWLE